MWLFSNHPQTKYLYSYSGAGQHLQKKWGRWKGYHWGQESFVPVCPSHSPTGGAWWRSSPKLSSNRRPMKLDNNQIWDSESRRFSFAFVSPWLLLGTCCSLLLSGKTLNNGVSKITFSSFFPDYPHNSALMWGREHYVLWDILSGLFLMSWLFHLFRYN